MLSIKNNSGYTIAQLADFYKFGWQQYVHLGSCVLEKVQQNKCLQKVHGK